MPRGVAAVYQNNWIEAVLCKVSKARHGRDAYEYKAEAETVYQRDTKIALDIISLLSSGDAVTDEARLAEVRDGMRSLGVSSSTQVAALRILKDPPPEPRMTKLAPVVSELFPKFAPQSRGRITERPKRQSGPPQPYRCSLDSLVWR